MWPRAGKHGFEAVPVAESTEPPAIIGSDLQEMAYPDDYKKFTDHGSLLTEGLRAMPETWKKRCNYAANTSTPPSAREAEFASMMLRMST